MPSIRRRIVLVAAALFAASSAIPAANAAAQASEAELSPLQVAVACAPPPAYSTPHPDAVRVASAQDTVPRSLFDQHDLLVLNGGSARGLALGQRFFIRRRAGFAPALEPGRHSVQTSGWIHIVAVNTTTAIAAVDHACGAILQGDYLVPFEAPDVPDLEAAMQQKGDPDFDHAARLLFSDDDRPVAANGEFMLIDRGASQGAAVGSRFAVYRDLRAGSIMPLAYADSIPLASVADAVVVAAGPDTAVVRIVNARDAVRRGDLAVPLK
jgi:hypothetical protein